MLPELLTTISLIVAFFACYTLSEACLIECRRRAQIKDVHAKAARFSESAKQLFDSGPEPDKFRLTPPKIETSFDDNERIGKI